MLSKADNDALTRVGPGTLMGKANDDLTKSGFRP
jgi:hypothetical protein